MRYKKIETFIGMSMGLAMIISAPYWFVIFGIFEINLRYSIIASIISSIVTAIVLMEQAPETSNKLVGKFGERK